LLLIASSFLPGCLSRRVRHAIRIRQSDGRPFVIEESGNVGTGRRPIAFG
jgi:hypothetical protein